MQPNILFQSFLFSNYFSWSSFHFIWIKLIKNRMKHLISGETLFLSAQNMAFWLLFYTQGRLLHFMCGFIYDFHSALEHPVFSESRVQNEKLCISRTGTVFFILQIEFKTFYGPKWDKNKRYLGIIWVLRKLWGQCLLLCLGLGQQLCHGTSRGLSDLTLKAQNSIF